MLVFTANHVLYTHFVYERNQAFAACSVPHLGSAVARGCEHERSIRRDATGNDRVLVSR